MTKEDTINQTCGTTGTASKRQSLIEWSLIAILACLGIIGFIQGISEPFALVQGITFLVLAGIGIVFIRDRYHHFLENYEFFVIWIVILCFFGYGMYHVIWSTL
jgi:hypothetical protein